MQNVVLHAFTEERLTNELQRIRKLINIKTLNISLFLAASQKIVHTIRIYFHEKEKKYQSDTFQPFFPRKSQNIQSAAIIII